MAHYAYIDWYSKQKKRYFRSCIMLHESCVRKSYIYIVSLNLYFTHQCFFLFCVGTCMFYGGTYDFNDVDMWLFVRWSVCLITQWQSYWRWWIINGLWHWWEPLRMIIDLLSRAPAQLRALVFITCYSRYMWAYDQVQMVCQYCQYLLK